MPDENGPSGSDWLLRGAFGTLQQAASERLGTAAVWSSLRQAIGAWSFQSQGVGGTPTDSELESAGAQILRAQGVGVQEVNQYRGLAGQWRGAHDNLIAQDLDEQIRGGSIFRPPWAITTADAVDDRYRFRVKWQITPAEGDLFKRWSSYEVDAPLTTVSDLLNQAGAKVEDDRYIYLLSGGTKPLAIDYELEQI